MKQLLRFFLKRSTWSIPYAIFLVGFVVLPLILIFLYAFQDAEGNFTLANFSKFISSPEAANTFVYSIGIAIITTVLCILLGYPAAYILSNAELCRSKVMVVLFILPMWINILVRTLATVALFDFMRLPLGEGALIFGMVYNFLPFMIYPIYNVMQKMDHSYIEAAQDGLPQGCGASVDAGRYEWHHDGLHAYYFDLCHLGATYHEQHQVVRYNHTGEYQ